MAISFTNRAQGFAESFQCFRTQQLQCASILARRKPDEDVAKPAAAITLHGSAGADVIGPPSSSVYKSGEPVESKNSLYRAQFSESRLQIPAVALFPTLSFTSLKMSRSPQIQYLRAPTVFSFTDSKPTF